jgi:hypothetical protein
MSRLRLFSSLPKVSKYLLTFATAVVAAQTSMTTAHADALDRVGEGASLYGEVRPVALAGALKRLGVDQLPAVQRVKQQVGGIDILDPAILAPTGLDVASPIGVSIDFSSQAGVTHARIAATLRDASLFRAFLGAIAAGGQLPIHAAEAGSAEEKAGIIATASTTPTLTAIARVSGELLIIDGVDVWSGKALAAAEVARRYSLAVAKPFQPGRGARRLFASDTAVALYADGRHFTELFEAVYRQDLEDKLKAAKASQRPSIKQKGLATMKKCVTEWSRSPATFDDLGLALSADPREVRLTLGWGTQGEPALGGLRFNPVDDGGVDADFLSRQAAVVASLFAASATPFTGLKHTGIYTSMASVGDFTKRCGDQMNIGIVLRGWPLVAAAGLADLNKPSTKQSTGLDLGAALNMFGQLRNVVLMVRDATSPQQAQFAIAATFDQPARTLIETLLSAFGSGATPKPLAPRRTPTVYAISNPSLGSFVGALENLPKGQVMFTFADSEESLQLAYRKPTPMPGQQTTPAPRTTPIASVHLDGGMVGRIFSNLGAADSAKSAVDLMARLKRLDGDLAADGDLFRIVLRAPLKP